MKKAATHTPRRTTRRTRWSAAVGRSSNALDLKPGIFTQRSARAIAASLKRSALASHRRKVRAVPLGDVHAQLPKSTAVAAA